MILIRLFVPSLFFIIGAVLLFKGYEHAGKSYELVSNSIAVDGAIVEVVPYLSSKLGKASSLKYFPEVRFNTKQGEKINFRSQVTSRADHYKAGDKVRVLYRAGNPQDAVIGSFSAIWVITLIYSIGGILVILFGSWFFYNIFFQQKAS